MGPTRVQSAVLLRKTGRQQVDIEPDFVMFDIPDEVLEENNFYVYQQLLAVLVEAKLLEVQQKVI